MKHHTTTHHHSTSQLVVNYQAPTSTTQTSKHRSPKSDRLVKLEHHHSKLFVGLILVTGLILGLLLSFPLSYLFGRQTEILDVTFINPRQALVFWQSDSPTIGYLKTGNSRFWRPTKINQISEQTDVIHTVMLDQLPLDGLYVSPHTEDQPWWQRSPIQFIKYQENSTNFDQSP